MKKAIIITFSFLSVLFAQSMTIEGMVKDKKTQKSLIGANVFIVGTSIGTSTDADGKYKLSNVKPGSYKVKASYIGYQAVEVDLELTSTDNITQDFELSYVSLQGEEIEVTAQARGQIDAVNEQIKAKSIKNIVSSDRIQELPDAYERYDLSLKQKLPVKGLELFLNISNLNEAIDVNRLRGFNRADPDFTTEIYDEITSSDLEASAGERLDMVPRDARAKSLEQHYGKTIDLGFRFSF